MKKILLTGATGYIGKRLLEILLDQEYEIICVVRDKMRLHVEESEKLTVVEGDFLDSDSLNNIPLNFDVAFFLMHSMTTVGDFGKLEEQVAMNFVSLMNKSSVEQVIYLSGMVNVEELSAHLKSRKMVEDILKGGNYALTTLRAGIIIGSGSASFEIIRDLVEKLPIMVAPKWVKSRCQPIAIRDMLEVLKRIMLDKRFYNKDYDVGGNEILTYGEMLEGYAQVRGLKRKVIVVPTLTPRLSSYWLFFVTRVPYYLAKNLVDSLKIDFIARDNNLLETLGIVPISYQRAVALAFDKIRQHSVVSSWREAMTGGRLLPHLEAYVAVPIQGCFTDEKRHKISDRAAVIDLLWQIGGKKGWYYADWLWQIRGWMDRMVGGVGLRRSRTSDIDINSGDALDFWRVIVANRTAGRLLLYAEMKLPGEAWLEYIVNSDEVIQKATFRPHGVSGRLYWYSLLPFHHFIFKGMLDKIVEQSELKKDEK